MDLDNIKDWKEIKEAVDVASDTAIIGLIQLCGIRLNDIKLKELKEYKKSSH